MLYLSDISSEILGRILDLKDMSPSVINLWMCGNRYLIFKLRDGVTSMTLRSRGHFNNFRIPELVRFLPKLLSFSLSGSELLLVAPVSVVSVVSELSDTLTSLELSFSPPLDERWVGDMMRRLVFDRSKVQDSDSEAQSTTYYFTFTKPLIEHLSTRNRLEKLIVPRFAILSPTDLSLLPASLKILDIDLQFCFKGLSHLPPQLTSLATEAEIPSKIDLSTALPASLTHLKVSTLKESTLPSTLSSLEHVHTHRSAFIKPSLDYIRSLPRRAISALSFRELGTGFTQTMLFDELPVLFPNLTHLYFEKSHFAPICITASLISVLPRTLTLLASPIDLKDSESSVWPPHLETLSIMTVNRLPTKIHVANFPSTLRHLNFDYGSIHGHLAHPNIISHLPRSLTSLKIAIGVLDDEHERATCFIKNLDYPPSLTHLDLWFAYLSITSPSAISDMPHSLESLAFSGSPITTLHLLQLPPHLTSLTLGKIALGQDISTTMGLSSPELSASGGTENFGDRMESNTLTWSSLLSRTLTKLDITTIEPLASPASWAHLPTHLTSLTIRQSAKLDFESLPPLPQLQAFKVLNCVDYLYEYSDVGTLFAKCPSISHLQLECSSLNHGTARFLPSFGTYYHGQMVQIPHKDLTQRRVFAYAANDRSELQRLTCIATTTFADLAPITSYKSNK